MFININKILSYCYMKVCMAFLISACLIHHIYTMEAIRTATESARNIIAGAGNALNILENGANIVRSLNDVAKVALDASKYVATQRNNLHEMALKKYNEKLIETLNNLAQQKDQQDSNMSTPMHLAVLTDNLDMVKYLVRIDASLTLRNSDGRTALHLAILRKNTGIVRLLLSQNKQELLMLQDNKGMTALHYAALKGDLEILDLLLKTIDISQKNTLLEIRDNNGWPALFHAILSEQEVVFEKLSMYYDNLLTLLTLSGTSKETALHIAAREGKTEIVGFLISKVNGLEDKKDNKGRIPLFYAIAGQHRAVITTLANISNKSAIDIDGNTARRFAVKRRLEPSLVILLGGGGLTIREALQLKNLEKLSDLLLTRGFEETNLDCLHVGVECNFGEGIEALLKASTKRAFIDSSDPKGRTPLLLALQSNCGRDVVTALLKNRPNLLVQDNDGYDAFWYALEYKQKLLYEQLLFDPQMIRSLDQIRQPNYYAHGDWRSTANDPKIGIDYVIPEAIQKDALLVHMISDRLNLNIKALDGNAIMKLGDDVRGPISELLELRMGLMHLAVRKGALEWIKKLKDLKFDIDVRDSKGNTPLHYLVFYWDNIWPTIQDELNIIQNENTKAELKVARLEEIEKILITDDVVNIKNEAGQTPLHLAVRYIRYDLVSMLLRRGADILAQDQNGDNLAHYAARFYPQKMTADTITIFSSIIRLPSTIRLLEASNKDRDTPLHLIAKKKWIYDENILDTNCVQGDLQTFINRCNVPDGQDKTPSEYLQGSWCSIL